MWGRRQTAHSIFPSRAPAGLAHLRVPSPMPPAPHTSPLAASAPAAVADSAIWMGLNYKPAPPDYMKNSNAAWECLLVPAAEGLPASAATPNRISRAETADNGGAGRPSPTPPPSLPELNSQLVFPTIHNELSRQLPLSFQGKTKTKTITQANLFHKLKYKMGNKVQ